MRTYRRIAPCAALSGCGETTFVSSVVMFFGSGCESRTSPVQSPRWGVEFHKPEEDHG